MPKKRKKGRGPTPSRQDKPAERSDTVVVSYLHPGTVESAFHESLIKTYVFDMMEGHRHIWNGGGNISIHSGANITRARNSAVRRFLDETDADWLWIVDSDMVWKPDALEQLLHNADPVERPLVGGLCFGQKAPMEDPSLGMAPFPTLFFMDKEANTYMSWEYPENELYPVDATGAAFLLVHRSLLERMRDRYEAKTPFIWFSEEVVDGKHFSEDIVFCLRAKAVGAPVLVHTGVLVGHVKPRILTESEYKTWWAKAKPALVADEGTKSPAQWWKEFNKGEEPETAE